MDKSIFNQPQSPTPISAQANRCVERIDQLVLAEKEALVQLARNLQTTYELRRNKEELRWEQLVLVIKTGTTLVLQWSKRRRIKRTITGRTWWWDRMPYDRVTKTYPIRRLIQRLPREEAVLVSETETEAVRIRERWAESTQLRITLRVLSRIADRHREPAPWLNESGQSRLIQVPTLQSLPDHADIAPDTFAGSVALFLHAYRRDLVRDAQALSNWVTQERESDQLRLRPDLRGNSLDLAWYRNGSSTSRLPINESGKTSLTGIAMRMSDSDRTLMAEVEEAARYVRQAWAVTTDLLLQTRSIRKKDERFAQRLRHPEFATPAGRAIASSTTRSMP